MNAIYTLADITIRLGWELASETGSGALRQLRLYEGCVDSNLHVLALRERYWSLQAKRESDPTDSMAGAALIGMRQESTPIRWFIPSST